MTENNKKERVSFEEEMELSRAVEFIDALRAGFSAGLVSVEFGDDQLTVRPGQQVTLRVKARRKDDKESVAFKISWKTGVVAEESSDLKITNEEPTSAT